MGLFSSGSGAADRAAANATAAQQGRAANFTTLINGIYDNPQRAQQINDFMGSLRTQLGNTTNQNYANTARQTEFATARSGLTGGSVDISRQNRNLQNLFQQRISDEGQVQDQGNQLRTQDQQARESLLGQAYGTSDVGQDALRSMIGQQAQNGGYFSSLLPSTLYGIGNSAANAYVKKTNNTQYGAGYGAGAGP